MSCRPFEKFNSNQMSQTQINGMAYIVLKDKPVLYYNNLLLDPEDKDVIEINLNNNWVQWGYNSPDIKISGKLYFDIYFPLFTLSNPKCKDILTVDFQNLFFGDNGLYIRDFYSIIKRFLFDNKIDSEEELFNKDKKYIKQLQSILINEFDTKILCDFGFVLTKLEVNIKNSRQTKTKLKFNYKKDMF